MTSLGSDAAESFEVELTPLHDAPVPDPTSRVADTLYVERMLAAVDPAQRAVVVLHYYLDLTLPETAAALGIPVGTAKSRLNRALDAMRISGRRRERAAGRRHRHGAIRMNRSNTTPRAFSTDQLRAALGDVGGPARPDYLPDIVEQAGRIRQRPAWTLLGTWFPMDIAVRRQGVPRAAVLFAVLSLLVALLTAGLVYVGSQRTQPERPLGLPTTPDAWERVAIETPSVTGRVASLAVSPRGLLAAVGGDEPARLAFSTDGRNWTLVPEDQHPRLSNDRSFGMPSLVGTDRGFLMLQLNEVWAIGERPRLAAPRQRDDRPGSVPVRAGHRSGWRAGAGGRR